MLRSGSNCEVLVHGGEPLLIDKESAASKTDDRQFSRR